MKFRRTCDHCGITFFSTDRKARFCQKHQNRSAVSATTPAAEAPRPMMPKLTKMVVGAKPSSAGRPTRDGGAKGVPKQRPPQAKELTPELRSRIAAAFQQMRNVPGSAIPLDSTQTELNLRRIHTAISQQLWVCRSLVAQVIKEVRGALEIASLDLTAQQQEQVTEMYRRFVESGERPAGGRRRHIAEHFNLSLESVVLAVRHWAQRQYSESETPRPSRQQLFEIEKRFWSRLEESDEPYEEFPDSIARELGFVTPYQVLRWVDVLYDDSKFHEEEPPVSPEQRDQIIERYHAYLDGSHPPEKSLHPTIADQVGEVTPRQVHKVLFDYRLEKRRLCLERVPVGA